MTGKKVVEVKPLVATSDEELDTLVPSQMLTVDLGNGQSMIVECRVPDIMGLYEQGKVDDKIAPIADMLLGFNEEDKTPKSKKANSVLGFDNATALAEYVILRPSVAKLKEKGKFTRVVLPIGGWALDEIQTSNEVYVKDVEKAKSFRSDDSSDGPSL